MSDRQKNTANSMLVTALLCAPQSKRVLKTIASGAKSDAEAAYKAAVPIIDRSARKGLIHANKAARHKSRLSRHIREMTS